MTEENPHTRNPGDGDRSQESFSWSEMADLTHKTQVEIFGWCACEDNEGKENPYTDCPTKGTPQ